MLQVQDPHPQLFFSILAEINNNTAAPNKHAMIT